MFHLGGGGKHLPFMEGAPQDGKDGPIQRRGGVTSGDVPPNVTSGRSPPPAWGGTLPDVMGECSRGSYYTGHITRGLA